MASHTRSSVRARRSLAASASLAEPLGIAVGAPLLLLEGTSLDARGAPVEVFKTWHRVDRVVFDIDVLPGSDARTAEFGGGNDVQQAADSGADSSVIGQHTSVRRASRGDRTDLGERLRALARELADVSEALDELRRTH